MALFGFGKGKKEDAKQGKPKAGGPVREYSYTTSAHFRGYKLTRLTTYGASHGDRTCQEELDELVSRWGDAFENLSAAIQVYEGARPCALLLVDGLAIGCYWSNNEYYEAISKGQINGIYIKNEPENVVDTEGVHARNRAKVFIKL